MASDNLWRRGDQWYLRLYIPRPLRKHFLRATGKQKDKIVEPLGDSKEQARLKASRRVAAYEGIFARLKAGEQMTPDQIKATVTLDIATEVARVKAKILNPPPLTPEEMRRLEEQDEESYEEYRQYWADVPDPEPPPPDAIEREIDSIANSLGIEILPGSRQYLELAERLVRARDEAHAEILGIAARGQAPAAKVPLIEHPPVTPAVPLETIREAAEAWIAGMQRDPSAAVKATTVEGHHLRVRTFVEHCGDLPLASVTRAMASDFLATVGAGKLANRTVNNYATTLASVFKSARHRGRFTGDNPFEGQKLKAGGESYSAFEPPELQTLFDSFSLEIKPAHHTAETALSWISLIAAFTGMRLEEIAQLVVRDVREQLANGASIKVIDIHNAENNALKNKASARLVPVHSELVRTGFLNYVKALPQDGPLFPGLTRRASKGGKIGVRVGELFSKKLKVLGLKRPGLCFHSFRHTVAGRLEAAAVSETDAARVLGHTIPGMSYGIYSSGPGLKRLSGVVEEIHYEGLKLPRAE